MRLLKHAQNLRVDRDINRFSDQQFVLKSLLKRIHIEQHN
jgi:hypothetical protein